MTAVCHRKLSETQLYTDTFQETEQQTSWVSLGISGVKQVWKHTSLFFEVIAFRCRPFNPVDSHCEATRAFGVDSLRRIP
jgi:hypothetical protein